MFFSAFTVSVGHGKGINSNRKGTWLAKDLLQHSTT